MPGSFELYDANSDGVLSRDEIETGLQEMLSSGIGQMPCICILSMLAVACLLQPEYFLGGAIQSGSGVTNDRGIAKSVTINAPPGIELGLCRARITHDDVEIPAKYNTETELGFELSPIERDRDTAIFRLKLNSGGSECER